MAVRVSTLVTPVRAVAALLVAMFVTGVSWSFAGDTHDGFEAPSPTWAAAPASGRVVVHERSEVSPHRGRSCERLAIETAAGQPLRIELPFGPAAILDELRASVWVRASRPDVRLTVRVVMPAWVSERTGRPVEVLVRGGATRDIDRWELLDVDKVPEALSRQLPALRLEHGTGSTDGARATHLVLDAPPTPGRFEIAIDDLHVSGLLPPPATAAATSPVADPHLQPAAATMAMPVDPPAGLSRGVLDVDGLPFFPRSIDWNGEPLEALAALGFNCVRFAEPASTEQLVAARKVGLWVICPPPPIPDVDVREPDSLPILRNWDRVLMWDLGTGLADDDVEALAERGRRVRACDQRAGRPLIGSADSGLRTVSRHLDMLVARKTVLGTSLELVDYLKWLRERPRLTRPGTPLLATISTEIDPRAARQAAAIAGVGGRGLAVDGESLSLAAFSALAAGTRGILFTSTRRLDGDDREARARAAAAREMNLRLQVLEPWGAAGRFAAQAQTSSDEVQAFVMEAARARMVVAWRCVQGSQIVARRYAGSDVPPNEAPLTILVPGVPEAHQAWEVAAGGLKPLRQQRVTGGVSVTVDDFLTHSIILFSGEPAVTAHVQDRIRSLTAAELSSARAVVQGPELLGGGSMERIEDLSGGGWRHFARKQSDIVTRLEVSLTKPASGQGCLRMAARPANKEDPPIVVETPPLWVTTPPLQPPAGKLIEISAQVYVPKPIAGSVDGLFVFDSLGGPALGERVGATKTWRRLVLHRIVPTESSGEPVTVTFALTGLGEAFIDEVSIRTVERGDPGVPAMPVSTGGQPGGFPTPHDLLTSQPLPEASGPATPPLASPPPAQAQAWPGMNLEWPKLVPFGQSANEPPPGPGGGTVDPFKRARAGSTPPASTGP